MIPIRLTIKNFLSYGAQTQTINFEPYHLICLSGKNGHGKSALLDAITWTLWGQARKISGIAKADEGLLRLGQTSMTVSLDFTSNGHTYRVRREFSFTAGKAYTHLDFGIIDPETQFFKPLTDKTIRDTQSKIDTAVGLNYEAFINSVFLKQGQSNEFSKKSAKERKDILLGILGLTHYEKVRKRALEKIRSFVVDKEHLTAVHEKLRCELATEPQILADLENTQLQLKSVNDAEQIALQHKDVLDAALKKLDEDNAVITALSQKQKELQNSHALLKEEFVRTVKEWRSIHARHLRSQAAKTFEEEAAVEKEYLALEQHYTELLTVKEQTFVLKAEMQDVLHKKNETFIKNKEALQQASHIHEVTIHGLKTTLNQLEKELQTLLEKNSLNLVEQKSSANAQNELETIRAILSAHETKFDRRKNFYHTFIARGNSLKSELKDTFTKKTLTNDTLNPCCPLCEQNLSSSRKKFLHTKFIDRERFINHQLTRITAVITALKEQLLDDHAKAVQLKKQHEEYSALLARNQQLVKEATEYTALMTQKERECIVTRKKLEEETTLLKNNDLLIVALETDFQKECIEDESLQRIRSALIGAETDLKELDQVTAKKELVAKKREALRTEREALIALHKEIAVQQQRKQRVRSLHGEIQTLGETLKKNNDALSTATTIQSHKETLTQQFTALKHELHQAQKQKEDLLIKHGALDQQLKHIEQKKNETNELQAKLKESDTLLYEYQAVEHALSKDGIQALLIENALPEIEQEANYLLAKLTDNQAHLSIESLRDLKSGGARETLDIKISDAMGIRPYELFSGGEAFRIDFALRIALSKLLARRSGTSLQTLIIDEGFGSQDEEGLAHIMDALYKIQEDFAKIIIVSHLPTMKDQFPVHFVVNKGPQGSAISVLEQD